MTPLSLTILVCSRFRHEKLKQFIASLDNSVVPTHVALELLLVINEPADSDIGWLDTETKRFGYSLRVVREPRQGLSHARNRGIHESTGDYVFFTDDDVILESNTVERLAETIRDADRHIVGGRVELHDPSDYPMTIKTSMDADTLSSTSNPFGFIHGCSMCISRSVLEAVGEFDTILGAGAPLRSGEDLDFVLRGYRHSFRVDYEPRIVVRHNHGRKNLRSLTPLLDGYALGAGAVLWKNLVVGNFLPARALLRAILRSVRNLCRYRSWDYLKVDVLRKYGFTAIGFFMYPVLSVGRTLRCWLRAK